MSRLIVIERPPYRVSVRIEQLNAANEDVDPKHLLRASPEAELDVWLRAWKAMDHAFPAPTATAKE